MARNPLARLSDLTDKQRTLLRFIVKRFTEDRVMPTVREMSAAVGLSSVNGCMVHMKALVKKGYLIAPAEKYQQRAYKVAGLTVRRGRGTSTTHITMEERLARAVGGEHGQ